MKIYIAGKWEEHELIDVYAKRLEHRGHEITLPWFRTHLGGTPLDVAALEDMNGVRQARVCIFIFERDLPYAGAFAELGIAVALFKRVIVVGKHGDRCVFTHLPSVEHVETFEDVLGMTL